MIAKNIHHLFIASFLEGGALMAVELISAKMIAPYYGSSLYVWSAVLATTLGGLALGYFVGAYISEKYPYNSTLYRILALSAFFVYMLVLAGPYLLEATLNLEIRAGITISALLLLTPTLACFGTVSPLIIRLITDDPENAGKSAGTIYAVSTLGGILFTFLVGFYMVPFIGLKTSSLLIATMLMLLPLVYFINYFFKHKKTA